MQPEFEHYDFRPFIFRSTCYIKAAALELRLRTHGGDSGASWSEFSKMDGFLFFYFLNTFIFRLENLEFELPTDALWNARWKFLLSYANCGDSPITLFLFSTRSQLKKQPAWVCAALMQPQQMGKVNVAARRQRLWSAISASRRKKKKKKSFNKPAQKIGSLQFRILFLPAFLHCWRDSGKNRWWVGEERKARTADTPSVKKAILGYVFKLFQRGGWVGGGGGVNHTNSIKFLTLIVLPTSAGWKTRRLML